MSLRAALPILVALLAVAVAMRSLHRREEKTGSAVSQETFFSGVTSFGKYKRAQTRNFYARPGDGGILTKPLENVRAAWLGSDLAKNSSEWVTELSPSEADQIDKAVQKLHGQHADDITTVSRETAKFPPFFQEIISRIRFELSGTKGLGFHLIRGIPVERWNESQQELFFKIFGKHVGTLQSQDSDGLMVNHVRDMGVDPDKERKHKTNAHLAYHCDPADVVGLLCLSEGTGQGGVSRVVSSVTVYNEFLKRHPDMVPRLYKPFLFDTRLKLISYIPVTPVRYAGDGELRTYYMTDYYRSAYRHPDAPEKIPEYDLEVMEAYEATAKDPKLYIDMEFKKGDLQIISNHVILHARTAFQDGPTPDKKRHLLRLWVSQEFEFVEKWRQAFSRKLDSAVFGVNVLWSAVRFNIWGEKQTE